MPGKGAVENTVGERERLQISLCKRVAVPASQREHGPTHVESQNGIAELGEVPPRPTPEVDYQALPDLLPEAPPEAIPRFATRRLPGRGDALVDGGGRDVHQEALCPVLSSSMLRSVPLSADANSQWRQSKEPVE